jgi:hypothetical protein
MSGLENNSGFGVTAACRQFDLSLAAYLEGEDHPEVAAHARECASCAVILADVEQIRSTSRELPLEEPPARLWANIRVTLRAEGIIHEPAPAWRQWIPQFFPRPAPLGALAGLATLALALLISPQNFEKPGASNMLSSGEPVTVAGLVPVGTDFDLVRTLKEMEQAYGSRESSVEPALQDTYRKSLEALDASIDECVRHCKREPGNTLARHYLMLAYQSKAEVLASALEYSNR